MPLTGVLVVEDEPAIRRLLAMVLAQYGHPAFLAGSAREGLALYRQHAREIGVALLDVQMPEMDGPQLLAALRRLEPHFPAVFMSGSTGIYSERDLLSLGATRVLLKPFTSLADLVQALRQAAGDSTPIGRDAHTAGLDPSSSPGERRRAARQEGNPLPVLLAVPESAQPAAGLVLNRSAHGLCVQAEQGITTGAIVNVRPAQMSARGLRLEVRHCRQRDRHWLLGCQFVTSPSAEELLPFGYCGT
jgi:CheY-like chemotaxis protein